METMYSPTSGRLEMLVPLRSRLLLSSAVIIQSSLIVTSGLNDGLSDWIPVQGPSKFYLSPNFLDCYNISSIDRLLHPYFLHLSEARIGHLLMILSMTISTVVESRRLRLTGSLHLQGQTDAIVREFGEAFHIPGRISGILEKPTDNPVNEKYTY